MRRVFCNTTSNMLRFMSALEALDNRGADEACLVVVDGEPGLGKTTSMHWWAIQTNSVFVRAKKEWTASWMMGDLVSELGRMKEYSFRQNFTIVIEEVNRRMLSSQRSGEPFAIVVDEADHISKSMALLETLRDISDTVEVPIVMVGMGKIRDNLARFKQISSRVAQYVRFEPATVADVRAIADACCEAPIADDLVAYLQASTKGRVREIKHALRSVELTGVRRSDPVTVADMVGKRLFNEPRGDAHIVRAA